MIQTPLTAVLFDLDGVLVQTEPLKAQAHLAALRHFGGQASLETYSSLMGRSHAAVRDGLAEAAAVVVDPDIYTQIYRATLAGLMETRLKLTPGAQALVRSLVAKGLRLALVSSSSAAVIEQVLERTGLAPYFAVRVSADDVAHKKPAPEPYLAALRRLGLPPERALAVEDSPAGVRSARLAGLRVIALQHALNRRQDFTEAWAVVEGLEQVEAQLAELL